MIAPADFWQVGRLLLVQDWIFAKTMPHNPHWYTLRKRWAADADFVRVVEAIRAHGYTEWYYGRPYTMLNANGHKYWTMGAPISETILINRKVWAPPAAYDVIAPAYDAAFADPASLAENAEVMDVVGDVTGQSVLDIGCGTGLFLEYATPAAYIGIDPSPGMLECFRSKHPTYAEDVIPCKFEEFVPLPDGYDCIVCLFGSANYISPAYIAAIPQLVRPGGRWIVMFYQDGYQPVTYQRTGHTARVPHWPGDNPALPGTRQTIGHFIVVQGAAPV
jgi:2-polyprenyl-3-methyl-5-hydroxy-6-metoxy-1,4-benzoquinol methylase